MSTNQRLSLNTMTISVMTVNVNTIQGVAICVTGIAQVNIVTIPQQYADTRFVSSPTHSEESISLMSTTSCVI